MSALDLAARGLAVQARLRSDRARIVDRLARAIARVDGAFPALMTSGLPTIGAQTAVSGIPGSVLLTMINAADRFSFLRGAWHQLGAGGPFNKFYVNVGVTSSASASGSGSVPLVRFRTAAPDFEIYTRGNGTPGGYRVKCNGQYIATGLIATANTTGGDVYQRITWGDGSAAYRQTRLYELEAGVSFQFGGVALPAIDTVWPAPSPDNLKVIVHGDSFVGGTGSNATALLPSISGQVGELLGQPDTTGSGVGGTGYFVSNAGANYTFIQRVQADIIARAPDIVIELGGLNDNASISGDAAIMQAAVRDWIGQVVAALPNVLIFMTGPMTPHSVAGLANYLAVRDGKKAAAAMFPRNVVFIDNVAEGWVTGTSGNTASPKGAGNDDWVTGPDGVHPSDAGHTFLARRVVEGIAARLADVPL